MSEESKTPKLDALTAKQRAFVLNYCETLNVAEASLAAKYEHPRSGHHLMARQDVCDAIAEVMRAYMGESEILARLARIARGDMMDFIKIDRWGNARIDFKRAEEMGQIGLIRKIKRDKDGSVSFELHDSVKALELLGKHYKLFTEVQRHEGDPNAPVEVRIFREVVTRPTGEE